MIQGVWLSTQRFLGVYTATCDEVTPRQAARLGSRGRDLFFTVYSVYGVHFYNARWRCFFRNIPQMENDITDHL